MAKLELNKKTGDQFTADEFNQIVEAINSSVGTDLSFVIGSGGEDIFTTGTIMDGYIDDNGVIQNN